MDTQLEKAKKSYAPMLIGHLVSKAKNKIKF